MKVAVTGATGFIGHHLVERLINVGDEVTCLARPGANVSRLEAFGARLLPADVTNPATLRGVFADSGVVYHVAGVIRAGDDAMHRVNADGVAHVADACAACPTPPPLVVVSSIAAVGPSDPARPHTEDCPAAPVSAYGRSKLAGELAARARADRVPITIVRPTVVFGPRDLESLELFRMAERGWMVAPGSRENRISFVHVSDLCQLLQRAAEKGERLPAPGVEAPRGQGIYFAAHPESLSFRELSEKLALALGKDCAPRLVSAPLPLSWCIGAISELAARVRGRPTLISRDKAVEATAGSWVCDGTKARRGLSVKMALTLDQRFEETVEWYRGAGLLPTPT